MAAHLIIENGFVTNVIEWDGETDWTPPDGASVMLAPDGVGIGWSYDGASFAPPPPPKPPVPKSITLAQARRQLRTLGLFQQIDTAASADQSSVAYDAWNYGNGVTRGEALAGFVQTTLAWSDDQMDAFMIDAGSIRL